MLISGPQYVEDGKAAEAPAVPDRDGYRFTGWDTDFSKVTGDMKVYAGYAPIAGQVRLTVIMCTAMAVWQHSRGFLM